MIDFPATPTLNQIFTAAGVTWKYDGTKWIAYSAGGDITGVAAGIGLNGGGTSGDVTLNLTTPVSIANGGTGSTNGTGLPYVTGGPYLPLTGGTLTGGLTINTAWAALFLSKPASGSGTYISGHTAGNARWLMYLGDPTAESGSNTGSNFAVYRYNDAGSAIDAPLSINRASGVVMINGQNGPFLPIAGGTVTGALTVSVGNLTLNGVSVIPQNDNQSYCGTSSNRWIDMHTVNATINTLTTSALVANGAVQYPNYGMTTPALNVGFGYDYAGGYLWVAPNGSYAGFLGPVSCDERLKQDVRPITVDALKAVCRVQLKAFDQLSVRLDPDDGLRRFDIGFVAQQLREVIPTAVVEPPIPDAFLGLDLMPLVAYLVGAVQQLSARLEAARL